MLNLYILPSLIIVLCCIYLILEIASYRKQKRMLAVTKFERVQEFRPWNSIFLLGAIIMLLVSIEGFKLLQHGIKDEQFLTTLSFMFMGLFFLMKYIAAFMTTVLYYNNDRFLFRNKEIRIRDIKSVKRVGVLSWTFIVETDSDRIKLYGLKRIPVQIEVLYNQKKKRRH